MASNSRLIVPDHASVNDGIYTEECSLTYVTVDNIAERVCTLGRGARLAKADVKQAYRQVPVHPDNRILLGMQWQGQYYIDATLPFGLRSAPLIFSALANALECVVRQSGAQHVFHYVDGFILIGPPESSQCEHDLLTSLGLPPAEEKTEGPATRLTVLGIEVDTEAIVLRLPNEKLRNLREQIASWRGEKSVLKGKLESLIGQLQHACKVVRPGRTYMRRLYNLLSQTSHFQNHYRVQLNRECQADIEWWSVFIGVWSIAR